MVDIFWLLYELKYFVNGSVVPSLSLQVGSLKEINWNSMIIVRVVKHENERWTNVQKSYASCALQIRAHWCLYSYKDKKPGVKQN